MDGYIELLIEYKGDNIGNVRLISRGLMDYYKGEIHVGLYWFYNIILNYHKELYKEYRYRSKGIILR